MPVALSKLLNRVEREDTRLERKYAGVIETNTVLGRADVSYQGNKRELGHRWCKYKEGFSASLIRYLLDEFGITGGRIFDPFAGSGTTLFIASDRGIDATGIELLPNSVEIIEVRKALLALDRAETTDYLRRFVRQAKWCDPGTVLPFPHLRITKGAFSAGNEKALGRYLHVASRVKNDSLRRVLNFAALCTLESISFTRKDGQYLRWDARSGRSLGKSKFNKGPILEFDDAITAKLQEIISDLQAGDLHSIDDRTAGDRGAIELHSGSSLDILPTIKTNSFDALITSPPYCNRYDYTRTYALELAMLGVGEEEIRTLRQTMLCCTVENRDKDDLDTKMSPGVYAKTLDAFENQAKLAAVLEYLDACKQARAINNAGIPRMIRNYFFEMALVIFECARLLKPGATFVMVNDNVRYRGAHIPVDLILSDFAARAGFNIDKIWVLPRGKGNSSQQMGRHGREELRKCIYVWKRPRRNNQ